MINCIITSPKETKTYKNLQSVSLPAFSGQMQVLSDHTEAFIALKKGDVVIQKSEKKKDTIQILQGECQIKDNIVTIIL